MTNPIRHTPMPYLTAAQMPDKGRGASTTRSRLTTRAARLRWPRSWSPDAKRPTAGPKGAIVPALAGCPAGMRTDDRRRAGLPTITRLASISPACRNLCPVFSGGYLSYRFTFGQGRTA